jgi:hypothetical protein
MSGPRRRRSIPPHGAVELRDGDLRDHGDAERIERVWERLEGSIDANGMASRPGRGGGRAGFAAMAMAAGVALGIGVGQQLGSDGSETQPVFVQRTPEHGRPQVFAAGQHPTSYRLPGGGTIELAPGSIVDTVPSATLPSGAGSTVALRLVRGQATLRSGNERRLALHVGGAHMVTEDGSMQVRLQGDTASLKMLAGSADVTAPDGDQGEKRMVLGPRQQATVPVRVISASLDEPVVAPGPAPMVVAAAEEDAEASDDPPAVAEPVVIAVNPCANGDYEAGLEQLVQRHGSVDAAIKQVGNASALMCISTALQLRGGSTDSAIAAAERVVKDFTEDGNAVTAAHDLSRLHRKAGRPGEAKYYARLLQERSKGVLLSADALCHKIIADGLAGNDEAVLRSSDQYRSQFPDGPCTDKIEQIQAAIAAKRAAQAKALAEAQAKARQEGEPPADGPPSEEEETYPDGAADPEAEEPE